MKIISDRKQTLAILNRFRAAGTAFYAPNGELPAEIEGICMGAQAFADAHGLNEIPVGIGMTGMYADNPQFRKMALDCKIAPDVSKLEGGDGRQGCKIWLRHLACYENLDGAFPAVRVLPFIDHGWAPDPIDNTMLHDPDVVDRFAIIMYDASKYEFDENIRKTAKYVSEFGDRVVVEGASDKIYEPKDIIALGLSREDQLSKPELVEKYVKETGVDLIVPNIGTEHRCVATGSSIRKYERELAQAIRDRVGSMMALHGTTCLGGKIGNTPADGIIKINFYTALAVGAGNKIAKLLREHEKLVSESQNLWINSPTYAHDIRRRHVADVCVEMFTTLGYEKLGEK